MRVHYHNQEMDIEIILLAGLQSLLRFHQDFTYLFTYFKILIRCGRGGSRETVPRADLCYHRSHQRGPLPHCRRTPFDDPVPSPVPSASWKTLASAHLYNSVSFRILHKWSHSRAFVGKRGNFNRPRRYILGCCLLSGYEGYYNEDQKEEMSF